MGVYEERPPRPAWGIYKRAALAAIIIVLSTAGAVSSAVLLEVKDAVDIFRSENVPIPDIGNALDDVEAGKPQTILLLGSDRRWVDAKEGNPVRSDTIMLVRLDPDKGATAVMNIPRDLKVTIPGYGTAKINEAFSEAGPKGMVQTVRRLLEIPIHHVVVVNFGGFVDAVNRLNCVYVDVDRRYYHSNEGLPPSQQYAEIDVKPGYQRLCGKKSLDYVRYRHGDNDFVRSSRQQDFLRQAKEQIGLGSLFNDRDELLRIFARNTQTDIRSNEAVLRLMKLAFESAQHPIQQIPFRADEERSAMADYVVASQSQVEATVDDFLNVRATERRAPTATKKRDDNKKSKGSSSSSEWPGLVSSPQSLEDQAIKMQLKSKFPVFWPKLSLRSAQFNFADINDNPMQPRTYKIVDRDSKKRYRAYRMVVDAGGFGQYYGIQGTTWTAPPILDNPDDEVTMRGRKYLVFLDGRKIRIVGWKRDNAVYWVSNTLSEALTNKQMLGIAQSLSGVGR
jgi:polyisoprenyl-teichoic acid--peptidoglycan teichoic acid transferase